MYAREKKRREGEGKRTSARFCPRSIQLNIDQLNTRLLIRRIVRDTNRNDRNIVSTVFDRVRVRVDITDRTNENPESRDFSTNKIATESRG